MSGGTARGRCPDPVSWTSRPAGQCSRVPWQEQQDADKQADMQQDTDAYTYTIHYTARRRRCVTRRHAAQLISRWICSRRLQRSVVPWEHQSSWDADTAVRCCCCCRFWRCYHVSHWPVSLCRGSHNTALHQTHCRPRSSIHSAVGAFL